MTCPTLPRATWHPKYIQAMSINEYTESWAVRVDEAVADPGGDRTTVRISSTSQKGYLQTLKNAIC